MKQPSKRFPIRGAITEHLKFRQLKFPRGRQSSVTGRTRVCTERWRWQDSAQIMNTLVISERMSLERHLHLKAMCVNYLDVSLSYGLKLTSQFVKPCRRSQLVPPSSRNNKTRGSRVHSTVLPEADFTPDKLTQSNNQVVHRLEKKWEANEPEFLHTGWVSKRKPRYYHFTQWKTINAQGRGTFLKDIWHH